MNIHPTQKKHVLVLADIHEGGEWISAMRLMESVYRESGGHVVFSLVGFVYKFRPKTTYLRSAEFVSRSHRIGRFSFLVNVFLDFQNARFVAKRVMNRHQEIRIFWTTDFLMALVVFSITLRRQKTIIFRFQGLRSALIKDITDVNYRQILLKILERLALFISDFIVVPAWNVQKYVYSMLRILGSRKRFYIVHNCASQEFYETLQREDFDRFRDRFDIDKRMKVILYSGRIARYKGINNLLEAFSVFYESHRDSILIFAYPTSSAEEDILRNTKKRIIELGMGKYTRLVSGLSQRNLIKMYHISNVLILPSELEMAPVVILEALATGTPCIGTPEGNMVEILSQLDPALILQNNSSEEIASKLEEFFSFPTRRILSIKKKAVHLATRYSPQNVATDFLRLMELVDKRY